ncbi:hypothetical protein [Streptomyces sp. NPDC058045]|uniref:hypothetical protein n=1 Tax=Streptomyces sp. NPDC058045 TaxID=3346311 RepID=UPI0036EC240B
MVREEGDVEGIDGHRHLMEPAVPRLGRPRREGQRQIRLPVQQQLVRLAGPAPRVSVQLGFGALQLGEDVLGGRRRELLGDGGGRHPRAASGLGDGAVVPQCGEHPQLSDLPVGHTVLSRSVMRSTMTGGPIGK